MTDVTVDLKDLQVLLQVTAAIKGVENALKQPLQDFAVDRAKPLYTAAHDRLVRAMNTATRVETGVYRDLTRAEENLLISIDAQSARVSGMRVPRIAKGTPERVLVAQGMLEVGIEQIVWPDSSETTPVSDGLPKDRIRLTQSARHAIDNIVRRRVADQEAKEREANEQADSAAPVETQV